MRLGPSLPRSLSRITRLQDEPTPVPNCSSQRGERLVPVGVRDKDLGDVPRHHSKIDANWRLAGRVAMDPAHPFCTGLAPSDIERRHRRVDSDNLDAVAREHAGERSRSAPDVEHRGRRQLANDPDVDIEVTPVVIHDVVQRSQTRVGEDRIRHRPMMDDVPPQPSRSRGYSTYCKTQDSARATACSSTQAISSSASSKKPRRASSTSHSEPRAANCNCCSRKWRARSIPAWTMLRSRLMP